METGQTAANARAACIQQSTPTHPLPHPPPARLPPFRKPPVSSQMLRICLTSPFHALPLLRSPLVLSIHFGGIPRYMLQCTFRSFSLSHLCTIELRLIWPRLEEASSNDVLRGRCEAVRIKPLRFYAGGVAFVFLVRCLVLKAITARARE